MECIDSASLDWIEIVRTAWQKLKVSSFSIISVVGGTHGCISPDINGTSDCLTSASDACACFAPNKKA